MREIENFEKYIATVYKISPKELITRKEGRTTNQISDAIMLCCVYRRQHSSLTTKQIGKYYSRDGSTVRYNLYRYENLCKVKDEELLFKVEEINALIGTEAEMINNHILQDKRYKLTTKDIKLILFMVSKDINKKEIAHVFNIDISYLGRLINKYKQ